MIQPTSEDSELKRLVEAAQKAEPQATRILAERACALALRTAVAVVSSAEQARDISQDVAVDVIKGIDGLRDPGAFDAWVHRITSRRARRELRLRVLRERHHAPIALAEMARAKDDGTDVVALRLALSAAIAELPPRQRLALALRYVHDLPDAEIAEALGCRVGTVHALLSRARASLRDSDELADLTPALEGGRR